MERFSRKMARSGYMLKQSTGSSYSGVRKVNLGLEPWSPEAFPAYSN